MTFWSTTKKSVRLYAKPSKVVRLHPKKSKRNIIGDRTQSPFLKKKIRLNKKLRVA